jgi:hypothetical protein
MSNGNPKWIKGVSGNPAGRPPGIANKRNAEFKHTLEKYNFNPAEALLELYDKANQGWEFGNREEKPIYLKIAADLARDICQYTYPKLKSLELKKENALEGMTPEERLEAMKQAVAMLEAQIKEEVK